MALNPQTPGVYVQEVSVLPPSIAPVATAIPAFIGYVEKAVDANGKGIPLFTPTRITSLLEYEERFGGPQGQEFTIDINDDTTVTPTARTISVTKSVTESEFRLYYSMQMYFANGGGPAWIVPVGLYANSTVLVGDLEDGLAAIAKIDEPTLLLYPDAISLSDTPADIATVNNTALTQCNTLKDRFTIMDVVQEASTVDDDATSFRDDQVGPDNLRYGASYYPYLNTTLNYGVNDYTLAISTYTTTPAVADLPAAINYMEYVNTALQSTRESLWIALIAKESLLQDDADAAKVSIDAADTALTNADGLSPLTLTQFSGAEALVDTLINATASPADKANIAVAAAASFQTSLSVGNAVALIAALNDLIAAFSPIQVQLADAINGSDFVAGSLSYLQLNNPAVYSSIIEQINTNYVTLNPSGAMAGIYARVDAERGVWKAPANVGINNVFGPSILITNSQQDGLNVDATSGKSINALRSFTGRGTLVWGGRTLAGNDNEWRYVNVRRLFIFVEESIQEATEFMVFEPNTANTWQRARGMIESFLTGIWRDGALAGATTEDAFFVRVGLGTTMTTQDILEGRMIVEVGLAAVRPAEFIILRFTHKLQES